MDTTTCVQTTKFSFFSFHLEPPGLETPRDLVKRLTIGTRRNGSLKPGKERLKSKKLCSYRGGGFSVKEVGEGEVEVWLQ